MPRLRLDQVCLTLPGWAAPFSLAGLMPAGRSVPQPLLVGVCLEVCDGERILLSGPDTSGIIGLLRLLAGRLVPTSGSLELTGSVAALVDAERKLDPEATGRQNLERLAGMRAEDAAELADLDELLDVPVCHHSPSMKTRLGFAAASAWSEVLLVEACLAKADLAFRPRMLHRLQQLLQRARIAVVAEPALAPWCGRKMEMRQGRLPPPRRLRPDKLHSRTRGDHAVNSPLRFRPYLRPMVWGGRRLAEVLGKALPTPEPYGEAWEISDHGSHQSRLADEPAAGTLRDLMRREPGALLGDSDTSEFPWLVKYLDACDWLSVQVHPDERSVKHLWPGENSKTEAWFILAARPGSRVYAGLKPGVDEVILRRAVTDGSVADCLHDFEPRAGDCLFLPAGTVHAVGGGVLIAEVQQTSDATFRLFDWNRRDAQGRSRQLHVEEALACIDWKGGPVSPVRAEGYPQPSGEPAAWSVWQSLVRCRYFHLDYVRQAEPFALPGGRMKAVMVLHGKGVLYSSHGPEPLSVGDTVLLPASLGEVWCQPDGTLGLLVSTLPALSRAAA